MDQMTLNNRLLGAKMKQLTALPVFYLFPDIYLETLSEMTGEKRFEEQYLSELLHKMSNTSYKPIQGWSEKRSIDIEDYALLEIIDMFSGSDPENIQLVMKILIEPFAVLNEKKEEENNE